MQGRRLPTTSLAGILAAAISGRAQPYSLVEHWFQLPGGRAMARGNMYTAEVGPKDVKKYVRK
jgi:hypothetical protein